MSVYVCVGGVFFGVECLCVWLCMSVCVTVCVYVCVALSV